MLRDSLWETVTFKCRYGMWEETTLKYVDGMFSMHNEQTVQRLWGGKVLNQSLD